MAKTPDTTPASDTRAEFNNALCDANIIAEIIDRLGDNHISGGVTLCGSHLIWLADELKARLQLIEVAGAAVGRLPA